MHYTIGKDSIVNEDVHQSVLEVLLITLSLLQEMWSFLHQFAWTVQVHLLEDNEHDDVVEIHAEASNSQCDSGPLSIGQVRVVGSLQGYGSDNVRDKAVL